MWKRAISNPPPYLPHYVVIGAATSHTCLLKCEKSCMSKGQNHSRCPGNSHWINTHLAQPWHYHQVHSQAITFLKKGHIITSKAVIKTGLKMNVHFKYYGKKNPPRGCAAGRRKCCTLYNPLAGLPEELRNSHWGSGCISPSPFEASAGQGPLYWSSYGHP